MEKLTEWTTALLVVIGVLCAICLIIGIPTWILWNLIVPDIFGLPYITFWEAVGLNLLCTFLFKNVSVASKK